MTEHLVIANRAGRPEHHTEAEPVMVRTEGELTVLELDDGERLEFNRSELLAATLDEAA